jgi:hypothetical protein
VREYVFKDGHPPLFKEEVLHLFSGDFSIYANCAPTWELNPGLLVYTGSLKHSPNGSLYILCICTTYWHNVWNRYGKAGALTVLLAHSAIASSSMSALQLMEVFRASAPCGGCLAVRQEPVCALRLHQQR